MRRSVPTCLLLLCLAATSARAGEQKARPRDADEVGRGLIAQDESVRAKAVNALKKAVAEGRANAAYLDALASAAARWADDTARLADVWIERAVEGDARERRIAVRLLHALGPDAVERLALELRHQRHRPDAQPAERVAPPVLDEPEPQIKDNRIAKIYNVKKLHAAMNPLKIRGFLQKRANASEVVPYGDRYLVLAEADGHRALAKALEEYARKQAQAAAKAASGASAPAADEAKARKPAPTEPERDAKKQDLADKEGGAAKSEPASLVKVEPQPASPAKWRLQPAVIQVPRAVALTLYGGKEAQSRVLLRQGTLEAGRRWADVARKLPDARELGRWDALALANNQGGTISAGKVFRYNKRVEKAKSGAYKIVSGELHHGYLFEFRPKEVREDGLMVTIETTRASISMPVPVRVVRPAKDAAPIELQEPQWSRTRSTSTVTLPTVPGGVMLVFQGLDEQEPNDDVVLVLTVEPNLPRYATGIPAADDK